MMLVPEGGWHCSGGRAGDSSSCSKGGGKGRTVFLCSRWRRKNNKCAWRLQWTGGVTASCSGPGVWRGARSPPDLSSTWNRKFSACQVLLGEPCEGPMYPGHTEVNKLNFSRKLCWRWGHWSFRLLGFSTLHYYPWETNQAVCDRVAGNSMQRKNHFLQTFLSLLTLQGMGMSYNCDCRRRRRPEVVEERKTEICVISSSYSTDRHILGSIDYSLCWQELSRRDKFQYVLSAEKLHTIDDATLSPNNTLLKCEVWGEQMIIWA